jgi:MFS family permease
MLCASALICVKMPTLLLPVCSARFLPSAVLQLPSNAALVVFGGPKWMAFICLTWGAVAAGFAGIRNEAGFLALRFLLGMFEAGAFPGCVYYVSATVAEL